MILLILVVGGVVFVLAVLTRLVLALAYVVALIARIVAVVLYVANGFTLGRPRA
jgi:hypothetical protein